MARISSRSKGTFKSAAASSSSGNAKQASSARDIGGGRNLERMNSTLTSA